MGPIGRIFNLRSLLCAVCLWLNCPALLWSADAPAGYLATARLLGDNGREMASCVIVGRSGDQQMLAVACAHQTTDVSTWLVWPIAHQRPYPATLIYRTPIGGRDWQPDLAVFGFAAPADSVTTVPLSGTPPRPGTAVEVRGYPLGSSIQLGKSRNLTAVHSGRLELSGPVQEGDSGGAVLDVQTGELLGIVSATGRDFAIATDVETLRTLLVQYCQWSCSSGLCGPVQRPRPLPQAQPQQIKVEIDYARILEMMAADPRFRGPAGETAVCPELDVDRIAAAVAAQLPPVRFQLLDPRGQVTQEQAKPLGQPIRMQLVPE